MRLGSFDLKKDGVYIIAEISANHGSKIENVFKSIDAIKEIGANAIKLQTYKPSSLTLDCKKSDFLVSGGTPWDGETLFELYARSFTPWEWHRDIFDYAKEQDLDIFSTPFCKESTDFLEEFNPIAYKIASFEMCDYEFVKYVAKKNRPLIVSTGVATIDEIEEVVNISREYGNGEIVLLKCTSSYPAPLEDANLLTIPNLKESFGVEVGFSDHTLGVVAPIVATALGAKVIEKHFILDRKLGGADASFSLTKDEFKEMVDGVRDASKLLGEISYRLDPKKKKNRAFARSLYISKDIIKGERFSSENIRSVRPGFGLHPKYLKDIIGIVASKDYEMGDRLELKDLL